MFDQLWDQTAHLFTDTQHLLIGCSGGPDSVFLTHFLTNTTAKNKVRLVHFNHHLRPEADEEQQYVEKLAKQRDIPITVIDLDVTQHAQSTKQSMEAAGRDLRLNHWGTLCEKYPQSAVILGHHQDDNVETVLLKLIRGSLTHWHPMSASEFINDIPIIRPLLQLKKSDITTYLDTHQVPYCIDTTNQDTTITRNKVRHGLMPMIHAINPNSNEAVLKTAHHFQVLQSQLSEQAQGIIQTATQSKNDTIVAKHDLVNQAPIVIQQCLYELVSNTIGHNDIQSCYIDQIQAHLSTTHEIQISLPGPWVGYIDDAVIELCHTDKYKVEPFEYAIQKLPMAIDIGNQHIAISLVQDDIVIEANDFSHRTPKSIHDQHPLIIRNRREGDRVLMPSGHHKKLKDWMIESKIPKRHRSQVPLIALPEHVVPILVRD